ncbi:MAG TPA: hypothetical protein VMM38_15745 [Aridibacter sp.]|nr:hypothetical protein [Aridibacter sp.]
MKSLLRALLLAALLPLSALSQTPTPEPQADDDDVVKITTSLIRLYVTVTDKKGNPVSDLTPDEVGTHYLVWEGDRFRDVSFVGPK